MKLTIGMASFRNFQEVWFTVQALLMYQDLADTEILVVDNAGDADLERFMLQWWDPKKVRYVAYLERQGTAAPRDRVFQEARGEWVMCIDSHVLLKPGVVKKFRQWCDKNKKCADLLQGPMLYDDQKTVADAFQDKWEGGMWGVWRLADVAENTKPYEIPMQGLGLFACRKDAWLGFNPDFRGFGGEEGYIHEKFRQAGRKTLCLPFLRWLHYFHTRDGKVTSPYTPQLADKVHNYLTGFAELGLDPKPVLEHFKVQTTSVPSTPPELLPALQGRQITNIQIDPNGECGARCWYCPVAYKQRPPRRIMPQADFEHVLDRIVDGMEDGSVSRACNLWLSSYNDILLDPLLVHRLNALRARGLRFPVLTNGLGILRNVGLLHAYRDVIAGYSVNLPAGDGASYERLTGGKRFQHDLILKGIRALHAKDPAHYAAVIAIGVNGAYDDEHGRNQLKVDLPAGDTDEQVRKLKDALPMLPRVEAMRPLCDRAGHLREFAIDNGVNKPEAQGCNRLTEWLHVNTLGQVYTCCQDYGEETVYGSLIETPIRELLEELERARGKALELCRRCVFSK